MFKNDYIINNTNEITPEQQDIVNQFEHVEYFDN